LAAGGPGCQRQAGADDGRAKELERLRAKDQREIKALKRELQRKEKAMAEMAALLVLRKKWEAFCSEDAEG